MPKRIPQEIYVLDEAAIKALPARLAADPLFTEAWKEWIDYRREEHPKSGARPMPVTPRAARMQLKQLEAEEYPIAYIERAIANQWQGLNIDIPLARKQTQNEWQGGLSL